MLIDCSLRELGACFGAAMLLSLHQLALRIAALLDSMQAIRSFQDLTKDEAPSSCSRAASASMSMPALAKLGQHRLAVAAIRRERLADLAVIGEGLERALRHGVDGEGRGERLHVEDVGGLRVLGAGAGPEQALRAGAGIGGALEARRGEQLAIGLVGALGDRDAEPVGQLASGPCRRPRRPSG